jgi:integrase
MPKKTSPKPKPGEPIRLMMTKGGKEYRDRRGRPRYEVKLEVSEPGQRRRQERRRFCTLDEARAHVDKTRVKIRNGDYLARDDMTLSRLSELWRDSKVDIRRESVEGYWQALKFVLTDHGDLPVQKITRPMIEGWVADWPTSGGVRRRGIGHRSIVYSLLSLHQVLDYGIEIGVLRRNPADGVAAPRKTAADHKEMVVWTPEELNAFVTVADQGPWAHAWRLTASGLRRSEVLGLDWSRVDLDAGTVEVAASRTKVSGATETDDVKSPASARVVPVEQMWPGTVKILRKEWMRQGRPGHGFVVVGAAGQPPHPDTFGGVFRSLSRAAGNREVGIHSVRHTIASSLHEQGIPPAAAARLLGHTVAVHLTYYVKSDDAQVAAAAGVFAKVFKAS